MIAHRLQTIATAENLLYISNPKEILAAQKGTQKYDEIMNKLKTETYKHQEAQQEEDQMEKTQRGQSIKNYLALSAMKSIEDELNDPEDQTNRKLFQQQPLADEDNKSIKVNKVNDSDAAQNEIQEDAFKNEYDPSRTGFLRVMSYYSPKTMAFGSAIASCAQASVMPLFGWIFAQLVFVIMEGPDNPNFINDRDQWILNMFYMILGSGFANFFQKFFFTYAGENLTYDVRSLLFRSLIYKQVSWFDRKEKAPGILTNILSEDITNLNGLTSETICTILEGILCLIAGIVGSAYYSWRMTVVCIGIIPFVMLGGIIMARISYGTGNDKNKIDPYDASNALLSDVILNYRTIISLGQRNVDQIMVKYERMLDGPGDLRNTNARIAGLAFGYSLCIRFIFIGVVFYIGSIFIVQNSLETADIYKAIYIIFTSALGAGFAMSAVPSANIAKVSAQKIFSIIDEPSSIDVREQHGKI